jgi:hypothetical protein
MKVSITIEADEDPEVAQELQANMGNRLYLLEYLTNLVAAGGRSAKVSLTTKRTITLIPADYGNERPEQGDLWERRNGHE